MLDDVKKSQIALEQTVSDINTRLSIVEDRVNNLDECQTNGLQQVVADTVREESAELQSRLDDFEDRARRENLIFYGLADSSSESWAQSEEKVKALLCSSLGMQLSSDSISRAHRLGAFVATKCRPIIVKFTSFKTKDAIFSNKGKLKGTGVSISADFCKATRNCRKKLTEYGKASGQPFSLRHNRMFINKKCFMYSSQTDTVYEIPQIADRSPLSSIASTSRQDNPP